MSKKLDRPFRLEIKVSNVINHSRSSYGRLATPVFHTWIRKCIAASDNPLELKKYADNLPLEIFYDNKRSYVISNVDKNGEIVFETG